MNLPTVDMTLFDAFNRQVRDETFAWLTKPTMKLYVEDNIAGIAFYHGQRLIGALGFQQTDLTQPSTISIEQTDVRTTEALAEGPWVLAYNQCQWYDRFGGPLSMVNGMWEKELGGHVEKMMLHNATPVSYIPPLPAPAKAYEVA